MLSRTVSSVMVCYVIIIVGLMIQMRGNRPYMCSGQEVAWMLSCLFNTRTQQ